MCGRFMWIKIYCWIRSLGSCLPSVLVLSVLVFYAPAGLYMQTRLLPAVSRSCQQLVAPESDIVHD